MTIWFATRTKSMQFSQSFQLHFRYLHTLAITENYIIVPETSYVRNICMRKTPDSPGYKYVDYDENLNGRFIIVNKTDPEDFDVIEADHHFFITHLFNAFEDDDGLIHVDVLKYENADIYTKNSLVLNAIFEENDLSNEITRYSIDLENEQVNSEVLVEQEDGYVEFSNINPDKYGQKYRCVRF